MQKQSYFWNKSIEESKNTHFLLEEAYKALTHSEVEDASSSQIPTVKKWVENRNELLYETYDN